MIRPATRNRWQMSVLRFVQILILDEGPAIYKQFLVKSGTEDEIWKSIADTFLNDLGYLRGMYSEAPCTINISYPLLSPKEIEWDDQFERKVSNDITIAQLGKMLQGVVECEDSEIPKGATT